MASQENEEWVAKGLESMANGHYYLAQVCFERAYASDKSPLVASSLGFCVAATGQRYEEGISLCKKAVAEEPAVSIHYLYLGRIYLMVGQRSDAIDIFRQSFQHERNPLIIRELELLGTRKPPVFKNLPRDHFINKYSGMFLTKLGLR